MDAPSIARILSGQRTLGRRIRTMADLRRAVDTGLSVTALDSVVQHVAAGNPIGATEFKYAIVPKTTLRRRQRLTAQESERLERLARITALAEHVWEEPGLAHLTDRALVTRRTCKTRHSPYEET